jgi:hypothetical protein
MSRRERKLVTALRDAATDLLETGDYAEEYMARLRLVDALAALYNESVEALARVEANA